MQEICLFFWLEWVVDTIPVVDSPELMVLNPSPSVMVLGDGALKTWVDQEDQVLWMLLVALMALSLVN